MYNFFLIFLFTLSALGAELKCKDLSTDYKIATVQISDKHDFYYCIGYLHAKNRGWQMDFFKRNAYGDVAETYGFNYIQSDLTMRTLNIKGFATTLWSNLSTNQKVLWNSYVEGVNAAYSSEKMTREFKARNIKPTNWSAIDSISVFLLFSMDHSPNSFQYKTQLNTNIKTDLTFPNLYNLKQNYTTFVAFQNNEKSHSTILATNNNISLKTPVLWYLSLFHSSDHGFFFGTSIPGIPFFYNGINQKIAWNINHNFPDLLKFKLLTLNENKEVKELSPLLWFHLKQFKIPYFFAKQYVTNSGQPVIKASNEKENVFYKTDWSEYNKLFDNLLKILNVQFPYNNNNALSVLSEIDYKHFNIAAIENKKTIFSNSNVYDYTKNKNFKAKILRPTQYGENLYENNLKEERILDIFNNFTSIRTDSAQSVLCDNKIQEAKKLTPLLIKLIQSFPQSIETLETISSLFSWNQFASPNCKICVFYDVWLKYMMTDHGLPRSKILSFIKKVPPENYDAVYFTFLKAFRDTKNKNLEQVAIPYFEHLAIVGSEQLSTTWQLANLVPTSGFENAISNLNLTWYQESRIYRPSHGSSLKLIFEFNNNIPKALISVSGKNNWYDRTPDKVDQTWESWSKCIFYDLKI